MSPKDWKLKPEHEVILAVVLSIVAVAIVSFAYYKIRTHTKALNARERQLQDLERNRAGPSGPHDSGGGGGGGGGGGKGTLGRGLEKNREIKRGGGSLEEKSLIAAMVLPRLSGTSTTADSRKRRSDLSDSGSEGAPRLHAEPKIELEGDMKGPKEIDGKGLSAATNKIELEGSAPPTEMPVEPVRLSWVGGLNGTGTMGSTAATGTVNSMARSPSAVSEATTVFRYSHRPSYASWVPMGTSPVQEEQEKAGSVPGVGNTRRTALYHRGTSSAMGYHDGEVSPLSPGPRSVRAFSLDGTVVEAQLGVSGDWTEGVAASNPSLASATWTGEHTISRMAPAVLQRDKWMVWRALGEETRRKI